LKKWTGGGSNNLNYDPFSNIKIVNQEQKKQIEKARVEVTQRIADQREIIETKYASQRAILKMKIKESEDRQKVTSVIMITIIAALFMAIIIFGMIKLVRHFSPDRAVILNIKDDKHNDFGEDKSNKSVLDVQYDANKEMFTEMYDTEHKMNGQELNEPELNLEMTNNINILQRSASPNMVNLTKKDKKNSNSNS
jgi:Fe2+ transport system protein B